MQPHRVLGGSREDCSAGLKQTRAAILNEFAIVSSLKEL